MRRWMRFRSASVTAAVATVVLSAVPAWANGGAYVEFEGTHHLVGSRVQGSVVVSVPARHADLLDRGPFYAYLLPGNAAITAGRPVPDGAIRLGTFTVDRTGADAELTLGFTVPDVAGDYYQVGLCNEPCTLAGFGEPVSGDLSIVATTREAALLTDVARSQARMAGLRRDLRKATASADDAVAAADVLFEQREAERSAVAALERELAAARAEAESARGRVEPWVAVVAALALMVSAWLLGRLAARRRARHPATQPA